jgi:putative heme iron utilization protein
MSGETILPAAAAQRAVDHMNEDHRDSLIDMAKALAGCAWTEEAELVAIDGFGLDIRANGGGRSELVRVAFDAPLESAGQLRDAVVVLARRARSQVAG